MTPYRLRHEAKDIEFEADPELLVQQRQRMVRRWITSLGALGAVAGLGACALVLHDRHVHRAERQQAWDRLTTCLAGTTASVSPEEASLRVRQTQLAVLGAPADRQRERGLPVWPARCSPFAHRLATAARTEGSAPALADSGERMANALSEPEVSTANLESHVRALFTAAADAHLQTNRATDVPEAPAPASPLHLATLPKAARIPGDSVTVLGIHPSSLSDGASRIIVGGLLPGRAACAFDPTAMALTCSPLSAPKRPRITAGLKVFCIRGHMKLVGHEIAMPRPEGEATALESGEFSVPGTPVPCPSALEDGGLAYLATIRPAHGPSEERLVRISAEGAYSEYRMAPQGPREESALGDLDDAARTQEASNEAPTLGRCRMGGTEVLALGGRGNVHLSFLEAHRWSVPISSRGTVGGLQCAPGEAILTRVHAPVDLTGSAPPSPFFAGTLEETHCTASACTPRTLDLTQMLSHSTDLFPLHETSVATAYVDGKLLVVWSAGTRGGLRMRMAPMDAIATVPDTVLYDDHIRAGTFQDISTLLAFRMAASASGAILFLETVEGTFALRIGATGTVEPLPTKVDVGL